MNKKIRVGILFGGRSAEHEVSLQSARNIYAALNRDKYTPFLIGIDKNGNWIVPANETKQNEFVLNETDPSKIKLSGVGNAAALVPHSCGNISNFSDLDKKISVDVVFPILHGPFGEDGTVQGLLKLADVPFVGSGVLGSAIGMDKDIMKRLLRDAGIPIGRYITLLSHQDVPEFSAVTKELGLPLFVKPANMGSSVGVEKIHNEDEYRQFIENAFLYDIKIIIEEFIQGREIECSVLGSEELIASLPGEVKPTREFYSYDAKYIDENGAILEIPAKLNPEKVKEIQELAIKTFKTLCADGLSRVDFFLKETGEILVNEINTMPGFTKISMYPKLFEASGISYTDLIDKLIELAFKRFEKESKLKTSH